MNKIEDDVRNAAYEIIDRKGATYYGIAMCLTRITNAILNNESSIITVSSYDEENDIYFSTPSVINKDGAIKKMKVELNNLEQEKLNNSINNLEWCTSKYNCNYGNHSKNISKSLTGRTLSEQTKKLMSDSRSIKVVQLSLNDELIKIWNSLRETDKFGYNHSCVSACCRGIKKTHRGFKWIYYNDYILMEGK